MQSIIWIKKTNTQITVYIFMSSQLAQSYIRFHSETPVKKSFAALNISWLNPISVSPHTLGALLVRINFDSFFVELPTLRSELITEAKLFSLQINLQELHLRLFISIEVTKNYKFG